MIGRLILIVAIPLVSLTLDLQHLFMGNVTSVPMTQEEYNEDKNNLTCKDILHMQYILVETVTSVPRSQEEYNEETEDLKCNQPMLKLTYVLNPGRIKGPGSNKTSIGCFCEMPVAVKKCLEYNKNKNITIIQPKGDAPCHNLSITPCKVKYFSSESYTLFECFEKYGGISSPIQNQRKINSLNTEIQELKEEKDDLKKYKWIAILFIIVFILTVLFNLYNHFYCQKLKIIIQEKRSKIKTLSSTSTDNGDNTTLSGIKRDQQKEENRDKDNSKREKRKKAVSKSIQYRPVCVQPEDDNDDDEIHKLCKEMPANISLKPKPKTSDVLTIY